MRFSICLALAMVGSLAACGSDNPPPVEECQGHLCGKGLLPDGGEIRFENFMGPEGAIYAGGYGFFFKNQVPAKVDFPTRGACNQVRINHQFPWASTGPSTNPAIFQVTRDYVDAGANITVTNTAGKTAVLAQAKNGMDYNGRLHAIYYNAPFGSLDQDLVGGNTGKSRTELQVSLAGSAEIPARTYVGGIGTPTPGITIPDRPLISPALSTENNSNPACDPNNPMVPAPPACCDSSTRTCNGLAFFTVPKTGDLTFTWPAPAETAGNILPDVTTLFIGWGGFDGNPFMMCIVDAANGTFTVSEQDLATIPDNGVIFSGFQYHQFNEIDGRRVDMVGTSCRSAIWAKM